MAIYALGDGSERHAHVPERHLALPYIILAEAFRVEHKRVPDHQNIEWRQIFGREDNAGISWIIETIFNWSIGVVLTQKDEALGPTWQ